MKTWSNRIQAELYGTCSATLKGLFYIFGGTPCNQDGCGNKLIVQNQVKWLMYHFPEFIFQIIELKESFERVGVLPFAFAYGACGTYAFPDQKVMLCFADTNGKKCWRSVLKFKLTLKILFLYKYTGYFEIAQKDIEGDLSHDGIFIVF